MINCLNPDCANPQNPDYHNFCQTCGKSLSPPFPFLPDHNNQYSYHILKFLGAGGFGRTYKAEDKTAFDRPRVIKKFIAQYSSPSLQQRAETLFNREGEKLSQLQHPQIPTFYKCFKYNDQLYLVQQFIDGQNLLDEYYQKNRPFNEDEIKEILNQLLPVLQYIHNQGLLHRDIKPENIMRNSQNGLLYLIDFGGVREATSQTQSILFTAGYAATEQIQGNPCNASDLYSLGATCVRLLTGFFPPSAGSTDQLYNSYSASWSWEDKLRQEGKVISPELTKILNKLLAHLATNRYQSAQEVINDLNPPQNQNLWLIMGILVFLGLVVYTISQFSTPKNTDSNPTKTPKAIPTANNPTPNPTKTPKAIPTANNPIPNPTEITTKKPKKSKKEKPKIINQKPKIINYENLTLSSTLTGHSGWVNSVQFSPDGKTLASGSYDKTIKLWDVATGQLKSTLTGHSAKVNSVQFSPDGKTLVPRTANNYDYSEHQRLADISPTKRFSQGFIKEVNKC